MNNYKTFKDFYPFYLNEHKNRLNRAFHFVGSGTGLICWFYALTSHHYIWFLFGLITGYAFAWVGHFFIEKNKPATFKYPLYSFMGDWRMFFDILTGQQKI